MKNRAVALLVAAAAAHQAVAFAPLFSIAQGLPARRSVAKFTDDAVPEDAVTKAVEGADSRPNGLSPLASPSKR